MSTQVLTMRDVAKAARVATSTVSKALRDDPSISPERCAEIKAIAHKLGYQPHPLVSALMAQLHHQRRRTDPHHLAWLDFWPAGEGAATVPFGDQLLAGAHARAQQLGYEIQVHRLADQRISPKRLRQILTARAQWGLIIPPVPETAMTFPLDLREMTAVTIGTSLREPALHRVSTDHFQGAQLACDRLRAKGFRRIGLTMSRTVNDRIAGKWHAAFLERQSQWPASQHVPPLLRDPVKRTDVLAWLAKEKPDAVLLAEPEIAEWIQARFEEGDRPHVVWLVVEPRQHQVWGIDHQPEQIGRAAVELVVAQIHRNERGAPPTPQTVLLDGVWVERG